MSRPAVRALFLDLDGTLADSLDVMRTVYFRFLEDAGRAGTIEEFDGLNGPPLAVVVERLRGAHGLPDDHDVLLGRYNDLIDAVYDSVAPTDGADGLLEAARSAGLEVGVVTSNGLARTRRWLERTGLAPYVTLLVTGEDVARGKPDPEPYEIAVRRAGCTPGEAAAVEDSLDGVRAAVAAGLRVYAFTGNRPAGWPWPAEARQVVSFKQLATLLGL